MQVLSLKTIHGPNVYHHQPVIIMTIDLECYGELRSNKLDGFVERISELLPGLESHVCSKGYAGGFMERLKNGTYLAHIIEHITLELAALTGIPVNFGKTIWLDKANRYEIIVRFKNETGMKKCLEFAVEIAEHLVKNKFYDVQKSYFQIKKEISTSKLGVSTQALVDAAEKKGIPCRLLSNNSLLQLGYGRKLVRLQTAVSDRTSLVAADLVKDKHVTKKLLEDFFIPVPKGEVVSQLEEISAVLACFPPPYAVKPIDGNHGNGVSLNLQTLGEVNKAFKLAKKYSPQVIIEEMCYGRDYRVLVVDGKVIAAAERIPPHVCGNGQHTVEELIEKLNSQPGRDTGHESYLTKIEVDGVLLECLKKQGMSLSSVPRNKVLVALRENANLSSGATAVDVTNNVHPDVVSMCERAARLVGLDICGIDLLHYDISHGVDDDVKIVEINAGPGLRMHLAPSRGTPRPVAENIIEHFYPGEAIGRIPIISVTGTNGKTTIVRMLGKIFSLNKDINLGMATTEGIWVGDEKIVSGDTTGPQSTRALLSDPKVDVALLEVARGGLKRSGLGYDWSDISVITNIKADHIGQDGIESVDDLIWIKSLVAERVKENGTLILNADDPNVVGLMKKRSNCDVFLYALSAKNPDLQQHILQGKSACWVEDNIAFVRHKNYSGQLFNVNEIPITLNGFAEFQISNLLAAASAAIASDVSYLQIVRGLKTFIPYRENLGRLNIFRVNEGYVILDYGHNEDAIISIGKVLQKYRNHRKIGVIGIPGDRADWLITNSGIASARAFDQIILREDADLRGRKSGKVPEILQKAILEQGHARVEIQLDSEFAIHQCLSALSKNEIAVVFYENLESTLKILERFSAEPVNFIAEEKTVISYRQGTEVHAIQK